MSAVLRLSALEARPAFALLAPGFLGPAWTLFEPDARGPCALWACTYEQQGAAARRVPGTHTSVALELDVAPARLAPRLDEAGFLAGVESIRATIAAGDVYQVNLTLRAALAPVASSGLFAALCRSGVARFASWARLPGGDEIVSASPEMLFAKRGARIEAEPMKGTAPPGQAAWLAASEKDVAELAMITDLLRDDLHRLCAPRSVAVDNPRRFVHLPYVIQAVSDVSGTLRDGVTLRDVLAQLHPGGSVTGAPRPAACAVIRALERAPRGYYCGALGVERGDEARFALLIRTAERTPAGGWTYGVGSGITWDSRPAAELDEVRLKLGALR